MTIALRDYQTALEISVFQQWDMGIPNVLAVCPTGGGKSLTTASIIKAYGQPTCLIVHRAELVAQLSETLAAVGITHRIVASKSTVALCVARHIKKFGRSFYHPQSPVGVVSAQTLTSRQEELKQWCLAVKLWVIDEAHHSLALNLWGKCIDLFPNARGLGVTATPLRCDRKSLGRTQKGVFDVMVEGPTMRWLIDEGYLSDYRYVAPKPSIHMTDDDISESTGEFKADAIRKKSHESRIVGDMVKTYLEYAPGKQAIAFVVDIDTAVATATAFTAAGIPAAAVSGKTPDAVRVALMDKFASGVLRVLVNVDLFDEGLDVVGVDVVIMGRPTMSLGKFRQQAGRMIRPVYAPGYDLTTKSGRLAAIAAGPKPRGMIIDHVENWKIHRMPDTHRVWSLISEERGKRANKFDDAIPLRSCENCNVPHEAIYKSCPHCGHTPEPASRGSIQAVDGDLIEFSPELLRQLRGEVNRVDGPALVPLGASEIVQRSVEKRWRERQEAQAKLRHTIALWAGVWKEKGAQDSESYRRFFFNFGTDVMSAMTLGATDAAALEEKIKQNIGVDIIQQPALRMLKQEDCRTLEDWQRYAAENGHAALWADYMFRRTQ